MNRNPYNSLFGNHPWLAHFLVHVVKRILNIIVNWIDEEAKTRMGK
jgi:hypothetical protein